MTTHSASTPAGSKQRSEAERLATEVLHIDNAVLSLLVLDKFGEVLAVSRSERLAKDDYMDERDIARFGAMAKVIIGMAANAEPLMGGMEFIVGAFKKHKVVFMNLPEYEMTLALRLARSAIGEYVCKKISDELATTE